MLVTQENLLDRDRARHAILDLISGGILEQDNPLSERVLSEKLKLGRTPVREAIRDLARDGILHVMPGYGTVLRRLTIDDLRETFEVRHALEVMACELAARRGATRELESYVEMYSVFEPDGETSAAELQAHNLAFHQAIFSAAANRSLQAMYSNIQIRIQATTNMMRDHESNQMRQRQSAKEHLTIIDAIRTRDFEKARVSMRTHLNNGHEARVCILAGLYPPASQQTSEG